MVLRQLTGSGPHGCIAGIFTRALGEYGFRFFFSSYPATNIYRAVVQLEEHLPHMQKVGSSNLPGSIFRGVAQFGGAPGSGPGGCRFESCHSDEATISYARKKEKDIRSNRNISYGAVVSVGRAPALQAGGREFKSPRFHLFRDVCSFIIENNNIPS